MQNKPETSTPKVGKLGFIFSWIRYWSFLVKKNLRKVFSIYASPRSVAIGASIGFFVTMLPIQGFQMLIALPVCRAMKGNFFSALGPIFLTNPITLPFFFFLSYATGAFLTGSSTSINYEFFSTFTVDNMWAKLGDIAFPLILGSVALGALFALIAFPIFYMIAARLQKQRNKHREMWRVRLDIAQLKKISGRLTTTAAEKSLKKQAKVA